MARIRPTRPSLLLKNKTGDYVPHEIGTVVDEEGVLTECPERHCPLPDMDLIKYARSIWPSLDYRSPPKSEAGRRMQLLIDEQHRRDEAQ